MGEVRLPEVSVAGGRIVHRFRLCQGFVGACCLNAGGYAVQQRRTDGAAGTRGVQDGERWVLNASRAAPDENQLGIGWVSKVASVGVGAALALSVSPVSGFWRARWRR